MRVFRAFQVRQTGLGAQKNRPGVDLLHQVVALERGVGGRCQANGARIVDQCVDAAEGAHGRGDQGLYFGVVAHVYGNRQGLSARLFHFGRYRVDRAGQFWMRLVRLGRDHHIGAVGGQAQCDRTADASASARDDDRAFFERSHRAGILV